MGIKEYLNQTIHIREAKEVHIIEHIKGSNSLIVLYNKPNDKPREYLFTFRTPEDADDFELQLESNPGKGYETVNQFKNRVTIESLKPMNYTDEERAEIEKGFEEWHRFHPK